MKYLIILTAFLSFFISCAIPDKQQQKRVRPVARFDPLDTCTKSPIREYNKAIILDSNNSVAHVNRGHEKYLDTDYAGAMADYKIAFFIDSTDPYAMAGLGSVYLHYQQYDNALKYFNMAIAKNDTDAINFYDRSEAKILLNEDYGGAFFDINKAIQLGSTDADSYTLRGIVEYHLDKYGESVEDLTTAILKDSLSERAYLNRGNSRYMLKDYDGALDDYDKCLSINPKNSKAYNGIGLVKSKLNNKD
jgi:lipoprotein NlpI